MKYVLFPAAKGTMVWWGAVATAMCMFLAAPAASAETISPELREYYEANGDEIERLRSVILDESESLSRRERAYAEFRARFPEVVGDLAQQLLNSPEESLAVASVKILGSWAAMSGHALVFPADYNLTENQLRVMERHEAVLHPLRMAVLHSQPAVRKVAAQLLSSANDEAGLAAIQAGVSEGLYSAAEAIEYYGLSAPEVAIQYLEPYLDAQDSELRMAAQHIVEDLPEYQTRLAARDETDDPALESGGGGEVAQGTEGDIPPTPTPDPIANYSSVTDDRLNNPEPHNWLQIRGNYKGWMNSPLDQINASNVANLRPAWLFSTGVVEGHQAPPIVNDGVMFVTTPSNQVIALEAATGTELWRYRREKPEDLVEIHPTNRGPGLYGDQLFIATTDCFLVALDAKSGEVNWEVAVDDYQKGYYMTLAPLTAQGKVLVGVSGGEFGIRGYVAAYNAEDGTQLWRSYTVPGPGEPGHETWTADSWQTGGGSTWVTGIFDAETGIVYWGVGNGAPWAGDRRGSLDNLYTTSVIALNLESGAIVGHHQYHWNDSWDWDEVSPPILTDLTYGGRTFKALVNVARNGHIFVLEPSPEGPIGFVDAWNYVYSDVVTAIDPETGRFSYDDAHWPKTNASAPFCPSLWGGKDWPYVSYSPGTGLLYIPANENICSTMAGDESQYNAGELWLGVDIPDLVEGFYLREDWDHIGEIQAWDVGNKNEVWKHTFKHHNWGPILTTGGGLLFAGGTNDRMFRAYDAATGSVLWEFPTNSGIGAPPSTYSLDGKQYVAVVSGWGVDAERKQDILRREIPGYAEHVPQGGVIWVFELP